MASKEKGRASFEDGTRNCDLRGVINSKKITPRSLQILRVLGVAILGSPCNRFAYLLGGIRRIPPTGIDRLQEMLPVKK